MEAIFLAVVGLSLGLFCFLVGGLIGIAVYTARTPRDNRKSGSYILAFLAGGLLIGGSVFGTVMAVYLTFGGDPGPPYY